MGRVASAPPSDAHPFQPPLKFPDQSCQAAPLESVAKSSACPSFQSIGDAPVATFPPMLCQPDHADDLMSQKLCQMASSAPRANASTWPSGQASVETWDRPEPPKSWNAFHPLLSNHACCTVPSGFGSKTSAVWPLDAGHMSDERPQ